MTKSKLKFSSIFAAFLVMLACDCQAVSWPPRVGEMFPDQEWLDASGKSHRLMEFKGKVVLVEYVGMNCPACNAFSGAEKQGGFKGVLPQAGLGSIEDHVKNFAGVSLTDLRLIFVQILLYDFSMNATKVEDAKAWTSHFKMDRNSNWRVWVPAQDLRNQDSYNLIPGFQVLDSELRVRSDSTGHQPKEDLYRGLLPKLGQLIR